VETDPSSPAPRLSSRISALRRFAAPVRQQAVPEEQCDLCSAPIPSQHRHLLEVAQRKIVCACDACGLRFEGVVGGRYALIPRDTRRLPDFLFSDLQWAEFSLPIDLAFFFRSTRAGKVIALYPGPAGAVESLLSLATWNELAAANPDLAEIKPDVEALLVDRRGAGRAYYLAPIDVCFELVGLIRMHWKGLSGGSEVWREIDGFFGRHQPVSPARAGAAKEAGHA
jgi:hypothetical protein